MTLCIFAQIIIEPDSVESSICGKVKSPVVESVSELGLGAAWVTNTTTGQASELGLVTVSAPERANVPVFALNPQLIAPLLVPVEPFVIPIQSMPNVK